MNSDERRALIGEKARHNEAYDVRFRAKVQQALDDSRPDASDDQAKVHFAERRATAAGTK
ncbi:hypothetical protein LB565_28285 [Mesorhizobium sp. CA14]|uniref:hypothetical protein n=1 Tax=Mesorhizobium sp. CA14 TaxID=2876642 RepID=UPI001CCD27AB|nr:hypothetical protein [Mesorhizobium sp. CA14]MBZ9851887.1 hypothetical protein [Mesorhizobium sp. CA14]